MTDTQAVRMVPVDVLTRCAALLEDPKAEHPHDVSYLVEELNALAAAPSVQPDGWQDISTAPKDGTPLLAGSIHHSDREVVCWQDGLPSGSMDTDAAWEGWVNDGPQKDRFYVNPRYFTHFMPLPAAPTGAK